MKIEWNKVTWYSKLIAVVLFVLTFWIAYKLGQQSAEIKKINVVTDSIQNGQYCYYRKQVATPSEPYSVIENIVLNINDKNISGTKSGTQAGPDMTNGYNGTLAGNLNGNILEAIYSYTVEGSKNKELEIYEFQKDSLVKMRYVLKEENKMLVPDKTSTPKEIVYSKINCEKL